MAVAAFPPQQPPCTTVGIRKRTRKDFPPSFSAPFFAESNSTPNHYIRIIFITITRRTGAYALPLSLGPNAGTHTQSLLSSSLLAQRLLRETAGARLIFSLLNEVELRRYARTHHSFCLTRKINHLPSPAPPLGLNEKADFARAADADGVYCQTAN